MATKPIDAQYDPDNGKFRVVILGDCADLIAETKFTKDGYAGGAPIRTMVRTGKLLPHGAETEEVLTLPVGVYAVKAGDDWPDAETRRAKGILRRAAQMLLHSAEMVGVTEKQKNDELQAKHLQELADLDAKLGLAAEASRTSL